MEMNLHWREQLHSFAIARFETKMTFSKGSKVKQLVTGNHMEALLLAKIDEASFSLGHV